MKENIDLDANYIHKTKRYDQVSFFLVVKVLISNGGDCTVGNHGRIAGPHPHLLMCRFLNQFACFGNNLAYF